MSSQTKDNRCISEDGKHSFKCDCCGGHLPHGLLERLDQKIQELEKESKNSQSEKSHSYMPSAFLYYLKEIRGNFEPKQECPFDV